MDVCILPKFKLCSCQSLSPVEKLLTLLTLLEDGVAAFSHVGNYSRKCSTVNDSAHYYTCNHNSITSFHIDV